MSRTVLPRFLARLGFALAFAMGAAAAPAQEADPPGRVAAVTERSGSVVFAPAGDTEWVELPVNRPLTQADRLWTDDGARAEVHLGTATLHVDDLSHLGFVVLDDSQSHISLTQGTVNARVRELRADENFRIETPNVTVQAAAAGDFRIDADPDAGTTRVTVRSGNVFVSGEGGRTLTLNAGQQQTFAARDLGRVESTRQARDAFDAYASERNEREDRSIAARHVPREVVGYQQLDPYGTWSQDAAHGSVWYPANVAADWAPYRDGRWEWVPPWGWTWIDAAPWGFAPSHYGRWARIGPRWAWVPGDLVRPVYAPAVVAFVGGNGSASFSFSIGSSPGIAWYPLAPGEYWQPYYRTSAVYVRNFNRHIHDVPGAWATHWHRRHGHGVTAVRVDDFNRGRGLRGNWHRLDSNVIARAPLLTGFARPDDRGRVRVDREAPRLRHLPREGAAVGGMPAWNLNGRNDPRTAPAVGGGATAQPRDARDVRDARVGRRDHEGRDGRDGRNGGERQRDADRVQREQREAQVQQREARERQRSQQEAQQREAWMRQREQQQVEQREQWQRQREQQVRQREQREQQREQSRSQRAQQPAQVAVPQRQVAPAAVEREPQMGGGGGSGWRGPRGGDSGQRGDGS
ncbi:DUF6600 domain-containing protein [Ramlibacter sp.]|uniref:DUF6600 domain-containing protein n=1 Tax=Ramlibacter sp. TaxID=1917967 RepID=UPI003D13E6E6